MSERDEPLIEAGRILRGETIMLAQRQHLVALGQLVREARSIFGEEFGKEGNDAADVEPVHAWLMAAEKVL